MSAWSLTGLNSECPLPNNDPGRSKGFDEPSLFLVCRPSIVTPKD